MSRYADIIDRLEKATGPDIELDGIIAKITGEMHVGAIFQRFDVYGDETNSWYLGGYGNYEFLSPDEYTASIDSAIALVERVLPGVVLRISNDMTDDDAKRWIATVQFMQSPPSASPSIAILIALFFSLQLNENAE